MTDVQKLVQFSVALVALGGFFGCYSSGERRIANERAANRRLSENIERARRAMLAMPQLEAERARLQHELAAVDMDLNRTARVARFVRHTADVAARHGVTISAMSGVHDQSASVADAAPIALDVTLEGNYAQLLHAVRDLSLSRVPASIDVASIARTASSGADAPLSAQLRVTLGASPTGAPEHPPAVPAYAAAQPT